MRAILITTVAFLGITSFLGCDAQPPLFNVKIFLGLYGDLAVEINEEDTLGIIKAVKENNLDVNYQDPKYGISLLHWSIANRKYYSCETLLKLGANPNLTDTIKEYVPPITLAAGIAETSTFLRLLLKYGGNPNFVTKKNGEVQYTEATPLNAAASSRLESVKLLVDHEADINLMPYPESLPLTTALITQNISISKYLVIEKKADINKVFTTTIDNDTSRIADLLRLNLFDLNSEEYKIKMELVQYLKSIEVDYRLAPIPKYILKNNSKDYLDKY